MALSDTDNAVVTELAIEADKAENLPAHYPLFYFALFFYAGGFFACLVLWLFFLESTAIQFAMRWLLTGGALALILTGRAYQDKSDFFKLLYLLGLAFLLFLFTAGTYLLLT